MRTFILSIAAYVCSISCIKAQTIATFDDLTLGTDTAYVNYSASGTDVGFIDGLAHFPCVYDTSWGGYWDYGWAYSDKADSVNSGVGNQYAARTGVGYDTSHKYAVAYCYNPTTGASSVMLNLMGAAIGHPVLGFYITNSTYAYNSMKNGDAIAHKFVRGSWFKLSAKGYSGGALTTDSVLYYLADFRHSDTDSNYIVNTWQWVDLLPLGHVDSLLFTLTSSDTNSLGMLTPAYFCMDNFTTDETDLSVTSTTTTPAAKLYPIPAMEHLYVDVADKSLNRIIIRNIAGEEVLSGNITSNHMEINTSGFAAGSYIVEMSGDNKRAVTRFVKR